MVRPLKLTPAEVDEIWARWRSGQAVKVLARQMRVNPSTVRDLLHRTGGIRPAPKRRWELRLSLAEREEISRGLAAGLSLRMIAAGLGRAPSTVSREVLGNGGLSGYRAAAADRAAWSRAVRPKATKLATSPALAALVSAKLALDWSPQQIAGWLKIEFPDDGQMQVSHESIYRSLFVQSRGSLRKELTTHLRTKRATRRPGWGAATRRARPAAGHPQHLPTPGRGSRPGGARPLGGRPGLRPRDESGGHPGREVDPVRDAGRAARGSPRRAGRRRPGGEDHHPARGVDPDADLGPRPRDGSTRPVHRKPPASRSTSATRRVPGSAAATRTPTASCANTYPDASTSAP